MPLLPLDAVHDRLRCPHCRSPLDTADRYRCLGAGCRFADGFRVVAGRWPVLIDPESSVLDPASVGPPTSGRDESRSAFARIAELLRRLVRPRNDVAAARLARLLDLVPPDGLILIVGGGSVGNGADVLYDRAGVGVIAFDIYASEHAQLVADAHAIPLADGSVDAVVVQAVLEHVLDPALVVAEIHRVLTPDGVVYAETPFMQQVHAGPYDFTRFSESGQRWLFRRFREIDRGVVAGPGTALSWSIDHAVRAVTRSRQAGRLARLALFWVRFVDRISDPRFAVDGASALYFLGRRSEQSITPAEAVSGYRGAQTPPETLADGAGQPTAP